MQQFVRVSLVVCTTLSLGSCFLAKKLPARYKSYAVRNYSATKDSIKYFVSVVGSATDLSNKPKETPSDPAKNIFSLSGEGQKQLIEAIADNEESTDDIYNKLAQEIIPAHKPHVASNHTKFNKHLSFSIDNLHLSPADRIMKVNISLRPTDGGEMKVVSCNKLSGDYRFSGAQIKSNPGAQPVSLSSVITADGLDIEVVDRSDNDLTGNVTANVEFDYKGSMNEHVVYSFHNLYNREKALVAPSDITINFQKVSVPATAKDMTYTCTYEATVRHVASGDKTISEADDEVIVVKGKGSVNDMVVVSKGQLGAKLWKISDERSDINIAGPLSQGTLLFDNYEDAKKFILWFKKSASSVLANSRMSGGEYQISVSGDGTLTDSFIKNCTIKKM